MGKKWKRQWMARNIWHYDKNKTERELELLKSENHEEYVDLEVEKRNQLEKLKMENPTPKWFKKHGLKDELLKVCKKLEIELSENPLKEELVQKLEEWEKEFYEKLQQKQ